MKARVFLLLALATLLGACVDAGPSGPSGDASTIAPDGMVVGSDRSSAQADANGADADADDSSAADATISPESDAPTDDAPPSDAPTVIPDGSVIGCMCTSGLICCRTLIQMGGINNCVSQCLPVCYRPC
ncbi:MAG: hypothetical protein M3O46_01410 [Myxococcota bacterium]|nr:hypothetical protein [Myxococcota bacterium]